MSLYRRYSHSSVQVLFKKVLKGEISPGILIRMSPEELASKELAAWRQRENRHVSNTFFTTFFYIIDLFLVAH